MVDFCCRSIRLIPTLNLNWCVLMNPRVHSRRKACHAKPSDCDNFRHVMFGLYLKLTVCRLKNKV